MTVLLVGAPACQVRVALQLVAVPLLRYPAEVLAAGAPGSIAATTCWPPSGGIARPWRSPWPGRHLGLAGRTEGPHASRVRAGPSASEYGLVSLSFPRPVAVPGPGDCEARRLGEWFFEGRYGPARRWGVTQKCACRWNLPQPACWHCRARAGYRARPCRPGPAAGAGLGDRAELARPGMRLITAEETRRPRRAVKPVNMEAGRHCRARCLVGRFHAHVHLRVTPGPGGRS